MTPLCCLLWIVLSRSWVAVVQVVVEMECAARGTSVEWQSSLCSVCKMRHPNPLAYFDGFGTSAPFTIMSITSISVKHYWMTFRSSGHSVLTSLGKSEFVQRAYQYMCTAKWRMHAYECGLKGWDSAMINVTGGNAWLIDDAALSLSLSLLSFFARRNFWKQKFSKLFSLVHYDRLHF